MTAERDALAAALGPAVDYIDMDALLNVLHAAGWRLVSVAPTESSVNDAEGSGEQPTAIIHVDGYPTPEQVERIRALLPPCLLPNDDTAVERLAAALESAWMDPAWVSGPKKAAERLIAALREGGPR